MNNVGFVHSLDTFSSVDGPGIRFVVFMQGCQMHCGYCQNRDTWEQGSGTRLGVTDILQDVLQYQHYYRAGKGGLTVSGGEPTLQGEYLAKLFQACKEQGIHTCLDTNGFIRDHNQTIDKLLALTDLVLLDIKAMDETRHINLTGVSNKYTLRFAQHLSLLDKPVWIRHVVVPGITDSLDEMDALGQFVLSLDKVERLELIAYHQLGKHKWRLMGQTYPLEDYPPASPQLMTSLQKHMQRYHPNVVI